MMRVKATIFGTMLLSAVTARAQSFSFDEDPSSGVSGARISLPEKQGTPLGLTGKTLIEGNIGEVKYSYSFDLPGWRGLFSSLSITYSSNSGYGIWGQGFSHNIPYIERSTQFGVPNENSPFVSSNSGDLTSIGDHEYRTRIEGGFQRYFLEDGHFRVMDGRGKVYYFGESANARESEGNFTSRWWLERIVDPAGHSVRFYYGKDSDSDLASIQKIAFVEKDGEVSYAVRFQYEKLAKAVVNFYAGVKRIYTQRVTEVSSHWVNQKRDEKEVASSDLTEFDRVRAFKLTYANSGVTSRSLIKTIQAFGRTDKDAAPAMHFEYSAPCLDPGSNCPAAIDFQAVETLDGHSFTQKSTRLLDINSDGLIDILSSVNETELPRWSAYFNQGVKSDESWAGLAPAVRSPMQNISFGNNDRLLMDINGDKRIDFLFEKNAYLNQGGDAPLWNATPVPINGLPNIALNDLSLGAWIDLNGDSKSDFVRYIEGDESLASLQLDVYWNQSQGETLNFSAPKRFPLETPPRFAAKKKIDWADMNGDGLADLVIFTADKDDGQNQVSYWVNRGDGRFVRKTSMTMVAYKELRQPRFLDLNGDGYTDALVASINATTRIFLNDGQNQLIEVKTNLNADIISRATLFEFGDFNGNGSRDMIVGHNGNKLAVFDPYDKQPATAPFLLQKVNTDLGEANKYSFISSARYTAQDSLSNRIPVTYQVVKQWLRFASSSTRAKQFKQKIVGRTDYLFRNGAFNSIRNEFLGFKFVDVWLYQRPDADEAAALPGFGTHTLLEYYTTEKDMLLRGRVRKSETHQISDNALIAQTDNDVVVHDLYPEVFYPLLKSSTTRQYEGKDFVENRNTFCTKLFKDLKVPAQKTKTEYLAGNPYRISVSNFMDPGDQWLISIPRRQYMLAADDGKIQTGKSYAFNRSVCKLEEVKRYEGEQTWKTIQRYDYDDRGNLIRSTDASGHAVTMKYDNPGAFQISSSHENAGPGKPELSKKVEYDYLAMGQISQMTDENGKVWRFDYDGLGRITGWYAPNAGADPSFSFEYAFGDSTKPTLVKTNVKGQSQATTQYFDSLMRPFAVTKPSDSGFVLDSWNVFDLNSNVVQSYMQTAQTSENAGEWKIPDTKVRDIVFDEKGRIVLRDVPGFQNKRTKQRSEYAIRDGNFEVTGIDPNNEARTIVMDSLMRTVGIREQAQVKGTERNAVFKVDRDAMNRITELTVPEKAPRRYFYDAAGRMSQLQSPDLGVVEFDYTPTDLLKAKRFLSTGRAPLLSTLYKHDEMGRVLEVRAAVRAAATLESGWDRARTTSLLTYDEAPPRAPTQNNLLNRVSSLQLFPGATYYYSYDDGGRQEKESLVLYGKSIELKSDFNEIGRLLQLTYPDGEALKYAYNERSGNISSVGDVVPKVEYDELNRIKSYTTRDASFDQDLKTEQEFEEITGYPTRLTVNGSTNIVDYKYEEFDLMGRILKMSGQDLGLKSFEKTYSYDKRGQLISSTYQLQPEGEAAIKKVMEFEYELSGDITRLGDKTFAYSYDSDRLLQTIKSDKGEQWDFAEFGRLKAGPGIRHIGWGPHFQPQCINAEKGQARYAYFPDGTRFSEVVSQGGTNSSTAFVNKYVHYHKEKNSYTKFYWLGDQRVAMRDDKTMLAVVHDRVNSGRLTLEGGTKLRNYSEYEPYGSRIVAKEAGDSPYRYQFAGQLEDASGLYQMGPRFYDPGLGRFISPDLKMLADPSFCVMTAVDCNLHVYASNDPVNLRDDSGRNPVLVATFAINFSVSATLKFTSSYFDHRSQGGTWKDFDAIGATRDAAVAGTIDGVAGVVTFGAGRGVKVLTSLAANSISKAYDIATNGSKETDWWAAAGDIGEKTAIDFLGGEVLDHLRSRSLDSALEDMTVKISELIAKETRDDIAGETAAKISKSLIPEGFGVSAAYDAASAATIGMIKDTVDNIEKMFEHADNKTPSPGPGNGGGSITAEGAVASVPDIPNNGGKDMTQMSFPEPSPTTANQNMDELGFGAFITGSGAETFGPEN